MLRKIDKLATASHQTEGAGFKIRRALPAGVGIRSVDPILLIDEMGPIVYGPGEAMGAPDHPHRGFETVTYMLDGEFEHRDSSGSSGKLGPGDVQWMTAGSGVVHSEMPSARIQREGGRMHGFQIWLNLPARLKMTAPRYQEVSADQIPVADSTDGLAHVRVIAGAALGVSAAIDTHTPLVYQHWTLQPGASVTQVLPTDHNGLLYVFSGSLLVGDTEVADGQIAVLADGDAVEFSVPDSASEATQVLLLGGVPHGESVVQHGPFVMNTEDEIRQAIKDYQNGSMGTIKH